jgi:hypothetical protein
LSGFAAINRVRAWDAKCVDNAQPLAILGRFANTAGNKAVRAT